jgi:hypothetical protein
MPVAYRINIFFKIILTIFGLVILLLALAIWSGPQHINTYTRYMLVGILVILAIRLLLYAYLSAIVIDEASITQKSWSGDKTVPLADLRGYRMEGKTLMLVTSKDPALSIFGIHFYDHFPKIEEWVSKKLPDLAAAELQNETKAIAENESLGSTVEDRQRTLKRAKIIAGWYIFLSIPLSILFGFVAAPWTTLLLFVYLLTGVLLLVTGHKLIKFALNPKQSPYPQISPGWLVVAFVMMVKSLFIYHIDDWARTAYLSLGIASLICLLLYWLAYQKKLASVFFQLTIFLLISLPLGLGTILQCNCSLDNSQPGIYHAKVLKMTADHTGKGSSYFLTLTPWGAKTQATKVDVNIDLYHQLNIGDSVEIHYWPGLLDIPWFRILSNPGANH